LCAYDEFGRGNFFFESLHWGVFWLCNVVFVYLHWNFYVNLPTWCGGGGIRIGSDSLDDAASLSTKNTTAAASVSHVGTQLVMGKLGKQRRELALAIGYETGPLIKVHAEAWLEDRIEYLHLSDMEGAYIEKSRRLSGVGQRVHLRRNTVSVGALARRRVPVTEVGAQTMLGEAVRDDNRISTHSISVGALMHDHLPTTERRAAQIAAARLEDGSGFLDSFRADSEEKSCVTAI
jgi:hypothetical protein